MLKLLLLHDDESIFNSLSEFKVMEGMLHDDNVDVLQEDKVDELHDDLDELYDDLDEKLDDGLDEQLDDDKLQLPN
jgi:hypothetical protein